MNPAIREVFPTQFSQSPVPRPPSLTGLYDKASLQHAQRQIAISVTRTLSGYSSLHSSYANTVSVSVASPNECIGNVYLLPNRIKSPFIAGQKMTPFRGDQRPRQEAKQSQGAQQGAGARANRQTGR